MAELLDPLESELEDLLVTTCKNVIRTILTCLENATKGTIYRIGPMPTLQAVRVTSGIRNEENGHIAWGLPFSSDYNLPGKSYEEYKDRPGHVLEAMGWCVEKQSSWTADNPAEDVRSVGKQLRGEIEDFHHMEPVLVRKQDLYGGCPLLSEYPLDWRGEPIWQDTPYAVCAVIKIHFKPNTIRRDDRSTRVVRELSSSLGTELLSLHFRESLFRAQKELARERLQTCEILAHELRNAVMKFGFILPAINAQFEIIRGEWERCLMETFPNVEWSRSVIEKLREELRECAARVGGDPYFAATVSDLDEMLDELASRVFLPAQGTQWIHNKVTGKFNLVAGDGRLPAELRGRMRSLFGRLMECIALPADPSWSARIRTLPGADAEKWADLAYSQVTSQSLERVEELLGLLDHAEIPVRYRMQIRKTLMAMNVLAKVFPDIEERANRILESLKTGGSESLDSERHEDCLAGVVP